MPHAGSGLEVHGKAGSLIARDVMTQRPVGEVWAVTEAGRRDISVEPHDLYAFSLGKFAAAIRGEGAPAASGHDGVKSLAVALAALQSAREGRRVAVDYGGF